MRLNIRCCCQPTKIFGTLEVKEEWIRRGEFTIPIRGETALLMARIIIKPYGRMWEPAIYSDDRPKEFWQQLPSFREGDEV